MRVRTAILTAVVFAGACKTPAPPAPETFDDPVIVPDATESADAGIPDQAAEPDETDEAEPTPPAKPAQPDAPKPTYLPKPEVPEGLGFGEQALVRLAGRVGGGLSFAPILENDCGTSIGVKAYADADGAANEVTDCPRVVAGVHALTNTRVFTKLGVLDASTVALLHDGDIIWSAIDTCEGMKLAEEACPTDFMARRPVALSFVGPELAFSVSTEEAGGGGPPYSSFRAEVIDVRTKTAARPYAMLDQDSLLNQLKRNSTLRRTLDPTELDAAKSVDEVWKLWRTQDFAFFGAYYYSGWDAENGLVDLRIAYLEDSAGLSPNELEELQVWVRPRSQWRSAFEEAADKSSGFFAR